MRTDGGYSARDLLSANFNETRHEPLFDLFDRKSLSLHLHLYGQRDLTLRGGEGIIGGLVDQADHLG